MIIDINQETLANIKNRALARYAGMYVRIYADFMRQVKDTGIAVAEKEGREEIQQKMAVLTRRGAISRNDARSIYINRISPACLACRQGEGSMTFFISLQCPRRCFFCFNPNQEGYEYYTQYHRDCLAELAELQRSGQKLEHVALTGGEPLLHPEEALAFFRVAREKFPGVGTRLYTAGDLAGKEMLAQLQQAGLDEIRFSLRLHDQEEVRRRIYEHIALAREYIPRVMVEMPVLPGTLEPMKEILMELDCLDIFGINLLEFCFPYNNVATYNRRGYKIKNPPYRILYNYWYGGGLPVSGSEGECLDLMAFALDKGLKLGVHYCSLENKNTAQIYRQNNGRPVAATFYFSPRDFFYKSAKVFGDDIPRVLQVFKKIGYEGYTYNKQYHYLEFHVSKVKDLAGLGIEVGISTSVMEDRDDGAYLRELKVDLTRPGMFNLEEDL